MSPVSVLIANDRSSLEANVKSFLLKLDQCRETVIGVDLEWSPYCSEEAKPSSVAFCVRNHCLFVLLKDNHSHESLITLLRDPNLTFVGMGIKEDLSALVKACGLRFRNVVELGSLVARCLDNTSHLEGCGLGVLYNKRSWLKTDKLTFTYAEPYDNRSIGVSGILTRVASNSYTYYRIGYSLLR